MQIGIWQRCQISRLFHEDAQGAQVIYLSTLPLVDQRVLILRKGKARLTKRLLGWLMAIYSPFCGAASAFI
jgi:hypothetical protein